ncbi:MAG TPA: NADH-quinone oxidoreductase subunit J [Acidobacteriota bacterium]|nr:NADH-quinone oxidoreductase subunit J [Acidobacteriota bacterium]
MEHIVFYTCATASIAAALVVVFQRRTIYSALALIVCFGAMAVLFFQLGAHFIAAIQVIVYAGAIMVLFVFVVMLIDPESEFFAVNRLTRLSLIAVPMALLLGFFLLWTARQFYEPPGEAALAVTGDVGTIARSLFREYVLPFEVTSVLILVAILGAMVLAKRAD